MRGIIACTLVLMVAGLAFAFPADVVGLNPTSQGLVGALSSRVIGPAGVFYNPATLAFLSKWEVEVGYASGNPWFKLDLKDEDGESVDDTDPIKKAEETPGFQYLNAGVGGSVNRWVGLGGYLSLNIDGYSRDSMVPPQTPYWLKYENSLVGQQAFFGFGVKFMPNFSIGAAALFLVDGEGSAEFEPYAQGAFEPEDSDALTSVSGSSSTKIIAGATFMAGVFVRPAEFLSLGLTYRGPLVIERAYSYKATLIDDEGKESDVNVELSALTNFSPAELRGGFTTGLEWVSFSFELAYAMWSQYEYPYPEVKVGPIGDGKEYQRWEPKVSTYDLADTVGIRLGFEFSPIKHWHLAIGYAYEPTPVTEEQKGTTNVLDANASVFGFSTGGDIPIAGSTRLELEAGIKYFLIDDYKITKDDAEMDEYDPASNPGYPQYDVDLDFYAFSVSARFKF